MKFPFLGGSSEHVQTYVSTEDRLVLLRREREIIHSHLTATGFQLIDAGLKSDIAEQHRLIGERQKLHAQMNEIIQRIEGMRAALQANEKDQQNVSSIKMALFPRYRQLFAAREEHRNRMVLRSQKHA